MSISIVESGLMNRLLKMAVGLYTRVIESGVVVTIVSWKFKGMKIKNEIKKPKFFDK